MRKCDACGQHVCRQDSVAWLEVALGNASPAATILIRGDRHIRCSPSRAQFITDPAFGGPVVDDRPQYDKRRLSRSQQETIERTTTLAWRNLQNQDWWLASSGMEAA